MGIDNCFAASFEHALLSASSQFVSLHAWNERGLFNTTKNKYDNVYVLMHSVCQRTIRKAVFERGECLDMLACFALAGFQYVTIYIAHKKAESNTVLERLD